MDNIIYSTRITLAETDAPLLEIGLHHPELEKHGLRAIELQCSPEYGKVNAVLISEDRHGYAYYDDFEYRLIRYNEDADEHEALLTVRPELCKTTELRILVAQHGERIRIQISSVPVDEKERKNQKQSL